MRTTRPEAPRRGLARTACGAALALATAGALAAGPSPSEAQDSGQAPEKEVYRVGVAQQFSAALDSAPRSVTWDQLRQQVAIRYEGAAGGEVKRTDVVFHAVVLKNQEMTTHHTSEPVEILPGATRFEPDDYLPEETMIPEGMHISETMGFGVVEIPSGKVMSDLLRDIILPMTENATAIYLIALPPDDQRQETVRAYPILVELASSG